MKAEALVTPFKDLMEEALKHYDEVSRLAHHFNSDIPKAIIKFYTDKQNLSEASEPPIYDEQYLNDCIKKATPGLSKIKDIDKTLDEIRGGEPKQTARPYYFDCWGRKGAAMTKTIWAITKEDAILLFGAKYPDYNYDPPYTDE